MTFRLAIFQDPRLFAVVFECVLLTKDSIERENMSAFYLGQKRDCIISKYKRENISIITRTLVISAKEFKICVSYPGHKKIPRVNRFAEILCPFSSCLMF